MSLPKKRQVVVGRYGRPKKRKSFRIKFRFRKKFFYLVFAASALSGIFYLFLISDVFRIKEINISGLKTVNEERVLDVVNNILDNKKLGFLSGSNSFIFSRDGLAASISASFPKLGNIDIKISNNDILEIFVEERDIAGIWCSEGHDGAEDERRLAKAKNNCFYFDKMGVIFEEAPRSTGALMALVEDAREVAENLGSSVLTREQVAFVTAAHGLIGRNFSFSLRIFIITLEGQYEILTSENWRILLNKNESAEYQLSNLKYLLDEKIQTHRGELEYVDLRLGNRVYYKYLE